MSLVSTTIPTHIPPPLIKPTSCSFSFSLPLSKFFTQSRKKAPYKALRAITEDRDLVTAKTSRESISKHEAEEGEEAGFAKEVEREKAEPLDGPEEIDRFVGKAINATIVLGVGSLAITRLLTIDHDYWHGWTLYEVLRYAPEHNWVAYEEALKTNPVLAKMAISGIVYSVGDWIAQCYEGKPSLFLSSIGLGCSDLALLVLHSTDPFLIIITNFALIPSKEWWVVPAKVAFDQTAWAALWNSVYFVALGFLRLESPANILEELKSTFWPMLTAGWKLWPFAHVITYGVIPVEQRLLWVDCVELIWVTILSTYSNEKSEARSTETTSETVSSSLPTNVSEVAKPPAGLRHFVSPKSVFD